MRLVRPGGVIVFDNALWHDRVADPSQRDPETTAIRDVIGQVTRDDDLRAVLLPVGDGLLAVQRSADAHRSPAKTTYREEREGARNERPRRLYAEGLREHATSPRLTVGRLRRDASTLRWRSFALGRRAASAQSSSGRARSKFAADRNPAGPRTTPMISQGSIVIGADPMIFEPAEVAAFCSKSSWKAWRASSLTKT